MKQVILSLLMSTVLFGQSAFETDSWDIETTDSDASPKLEWSGFYEFEPRYFVQNDGEDNSETVQTLVLSAAVEHRRSSFNASFKLNSQTQSASIDELYFTSQLGRVEFDAGLQILVWGKGDQLHLVDNINADDYSDFIFPDYLERRIGENMLRMNAVIGPYSWNSQFEVVIAPGFTKMVFPDNGPWAPQYLNILNSVAPALYLNGIQISETDYTGYSNGQAACRWTQSLGGIDYGFSYYNGKSRIPTFQMSSYDSLGMPHQMNIINNDLQVYGLEFSTAIKGVNLRSEIARFITNDPDGIHYDILNPKWSLLLGGDVNLPVHNININIQYIRDFVTDENELLFDTYQAQMLTLVTYLGLDPSFANLNMNNYWENNLISFRLGDSFFRETFKPEIQFVHRFETEDEMMTLKCDYSINDQLHVMALYRQFSGKSNTVFGQYDNNDFASLRMEYRF